MERITLTAPDISCEHCQRTIEREIGGMQGVGAVAVDVAARRVEVSYDPSLTSRDTIVGRLDEEGYPVSG